jgi:hypothetical protein
VFISLFRPVWFGSPCWGWAGNEAHANNTVYCPAPARGAAGCLPSGPVRSGENACIPPGYRRRVVVCTPAPHSQGGGGGGPQLHNDGGGSAAQAASWIQETRRCPYPLSIRGEEVPSISPIISPRDESATVAGGSSQCARVRWPVRRSRACCLRKADEPSIILTGRHRRAGNYFFLLRCRPRVGPTQSTTRRIGGPATGRRASAGSGKYCLDDATRRGALGSGSGAGTAPRSPCADCVGTRAALFESRGNLHATSW